jgi:thioredoxin reductase
VRKAALEAALVKRKPHIFDVAIVGGGPAGLSAALVLGRCRRKVVVFDDESPRNQQARATHGFFTRDGTPPGELLQLGRAELAPYDVRFIDAHVDGVVRCDASFAIQAADQPTVVARKLLLATGMRDRMPELPGFADCWGSGVYQCPYCHGWEVRDRALGAYGVGPKVFDLGLGLLTWSSEVSVFTDNKFPVTPADMERARDHGVAVYTEAIESLIVNERRLSGVRMRSGKFVKCEAMFVRAGQEQRSHFAAELGCELTAENTVKTYHNERTSVPGVFVAGDASVELQSIAVSVAEGYKAAVAIHLELCKEARAEGFTPARSAVRAVRRRPPGRQASRPRPSRWG